MDPKRRVGRREDLEYLSGSDREHYAASLRAISRMRENPTLSLSEAARLEGTTPRRVRHFAGDALERHGTRWNVTKGDRLYRPMFVNSGGMTVAVDVRGSNKASELSAYHRAVSHYLRTGDDGLLSRFTGRTVAGVAYETDLEMLEEMARRGRLDVESIYQFVVR